MTEAFVQELVAGDVEEAMELSTVESQVLLGMAETFGKLPFPSKLEFELVEEKINGNEARVKFRDKLSGKSERVRLRKVDGNWKVHLDKY